jgi:hypothetical protein
MPLRFVHMFAFTECKCAQVDLDTCAGVIGATVEALRTAGPVRAADGAICAAAVAESTFQRESGDP